MGGLVEEMVQRSTVARLSSATRIFPERRSGRGPPREPPGGTLTRSACASSPCQPAAGDPCGPDRRPPSKNQLRPRAHRRSGRRHRRDRRLAPREPVIEASATSAPDGRVAAQRRLARPRRVREPRRWPRARRGEALHDDGRTD